MRNKKRTKLGLSVLQDKIQDMTNARNGSRSNQIYMIVHGGSNDCLTKNQITRNYNT